MPRHTDQTLVIFGQNVQRLRHELGLSQEKLAELADLHKNYVGFIERAERSISLLAAQKLAEALHSDITSLLGPVAAGSHSKQS